MDQLVGLFVLLFIGVCVCVFTEVQTPQCIKPELLRKGFEKVKAENLEVTDDVSIIEQLGEPVRITTGDYYNIKLTTPEDLQLAESVLSS